MTINVSNIKLNQITHLFTQGYLPASLIAYYSLNYSFFLTNIHYDNKTLWVLFKLKVFLWKECHAIPALAPRNAMQFLHWLLAHHRISFKIDINIPIKVYWQVVIFMGLHTMFSYFFLGVFLTFSGQSGPLNLLPHSQVTLLFYSLMVRTCWITFILLWLLVPHWWIYFTLFTTIPRNNTHHNHHQEAHWHRWNTQWVNSPAATMIPLIWVKKIVIEEVYPSSSVLLAKPVGQTQVKPSRVFNQPTYTMLGCRMQGGLYCTVLYCTRVVVIWGC